MELLDYTEEELTRISTRGSKQEKVYLLVRTITGRTYQDFGILAFSPKFRELLRENLDNIKIISWKACERGRLCICRIGQDEYAVKEMTKNELPIAKRAEEIGVGPKIIENIKEAYDVTVLEEKAPGKEIYHLVRNKPYHLLSRNRLSPEKTGEIAGDAVGRLHNAGIIYGYKTPEGLFTHLFYDTKTGRATLIDYNVSRLFHPEEMISSVPSPSYRECMENELGVFENQFKRVFGKNHEKAWSSFMRTYQAVSL